MWTQTGIVEFDIDEFRRWADHYDYYFDVTTRVDHERSSDPRKQCRVVFSWADAGDERVEFGDQEWNLDFSETPETFFEVDEAGIARTQLPDHSFILDLERIEHREADLLLCTGDSERHLPCSEF